MGDRSWHRPASPEHRSTMQPPRFLLGSCLLANAPARDAGGGDRSQPLRKPTNGPGQRQFHHDSLHAGRWCVIEGALARPTSLGRVDRPDGDSLLGLVQDPDQ